MTPEELFEAHGLQSELEQINRALLKVDPDRYEVPITIGEYQCFVVRGAEAVAWLRQIRQGRIDRLAVLGVVQPEES